MAKKPKPAGPAPKCGDTYTCGSCDMELEITADCGCDDGAAVSFNCCGSEMVWTEAEAEPDATCEADA